jgi:hypothetical protein
MSILSGYWRMAALAAISMSLAWRIRGQFGHEIGAAMAGALGAMAIALLSGRHDWRRRVDYFAFLGALGWSFGGSISYMKVIGYCHSSDSATVLYGFAGVFLIGLLWAALGGMGTALAAVLDDQRLAALFPALAAVFGAWFLETVLADLYRTAGGGSLNWFDTDWLSAATALAAVLILSLARRRFDFGTSLVLHLAAGWWAGFLVLVVALGLHLNPPRGDNWAGVAGLFLGGLLFCRRYKLTAVARVSLITGFLGATGFVLGQIIKLALIATGVKWGWHTVMEWTHGLFFGVALALAMATLARDESEVRRPAPRWTAVFSLFFVLWVIPYLNFSRSPLLWLKQVKTLTPYAYGIPVASGFAPSRGFLGWFDWLFLALGALILWRLLRESRQPSPLMPASWLGKGQLLYLVFLWTITFISGAHEIPGLAPLGFVIQWTITVHAVLCTAVLLGCVPQALPAPVPVPATQLTGLRKIVAFGLLAAVLSSFAGWSAKRALYGDAFGGFFYMDHIRFGPNNTNTIK